MKLFKKFIVGLGASLALACGGLAVAQIVTVPTVSSIGSTDAFHELPNGQTASTNVYASAAQLKSWILGQNSQHLTAPTLTTSTTVCGGSTATVSGTDTSGQVAEGSSASTSCVITFAKAFVTAPECFVSIDNLTDSALKCHATTTTLTVTQSSASSNVLNYLVVGLAGG